MIAPKLSAEPRPTRRVRRLRKPKSSNLGKFCTVVLAVVAISLLYASLCAVATCKEYSRTRLLLETQRLKAENQLLEAEVQRLESPQRVIASAEKLGMVRSCRPEFVFPSPKLANAPRKTAKAMPVRRSYPEQLVGMVSINP